MLQQVYHKQTLSGTKDSKKDGRMLRMIPGVEGLTPVEMKPIRGMVHYEFLPPGQTVNQHIYKEILQCLLFSVREKRQDLSESGCFTTTMRPHTQP